MIGCTPEQARAIAEAARYAGLHERDVGHVHACLERDPSEWMFCCGSACNPCVMTIRRAVDKAREILGLPAFE